MNSRRQQEPQMTAKKLIFYLRSACFSGFYGKNTVLKEKGLGNLGQHGFYQSKTTTDNDRVRKQGFLWKRGLSRKVHFLENLEILEFLEKPPNSEKHRRFRPFSSDSREFKDFSDSRDFSSEKTPFVATPTSVPEMTCDQQTRTYEQMEGLHCTLSLAKRPLRVTQLRLWEKGRGACLLEEISVAVLC